MLRLGCGNCRWEGRESPAADGLRSSWKCLDTFRRLGYVEQYRERLLRATARDIADELPARVEQGHSTTRYHA